VLVVPVAPLWKISRTLTMLMVMTLHGNSLKTRTWTALREATPVHSPSKPVVAALAVTRRPRTTALMAQLVVQLAPLPCLLVQVVQVVPLWLEQAPTLRLAWVAQ
jgi:hypothetical protein